MDVPSATEFWTGLKVTDLVISAAAVAAACFAYLQWRVYVRQSEILDKTKTIAESGLSRPYVLIESVSYRTKEGSEDLLYYFDFQLRNFGNSPAIIKKIVATGFVSSGQRGPRARDKYPAEIFPEPPELITLLGDRPSVRVFPQAQPDFDFRSGEWSFAIRQSSIVLMSGKRSPVFSYFAKDICLKLTDRLFSNEGDRLRDAAPWVIGKVTYLDVYGGTHRTSFCFRGREDGIAEEYGGPSYNERT